MKFMMHRDRTIPSTSGHCIEFKKGVLTHVPPCMYEEVMAAGAVPEEELNLDEKPKDENTEPQDPTVRKKALFETFAKIVTRNRREDFSASGAPHHKVVASELGWATLHAKELNPAWTEFKTGKAED